MDKLMLPQSSSSPSKLYASQPTNNPPHIKPEWYFLFAYTILRSIPNKLGGVLALLLSILILFTISMLHTSKQRTMTFRPATQMMFWLIVANMTILTWIGGQPVEEPFIMIGQISSILYFMFIILIPLTGLAENKLLN